MTLSLRAKISILVGSAVVAVIAIIFFFFYMFPGQPDSGSKEKLPDNVQPAQVLEEQKTAKVTAAPPTPQEISDTFGKALAQMFVERFGTYTNHSNYESIEQLIPSMTTTMAAWVADTYLPKLRTDNPQTGFFYRITAEAPMAQVLSQTETTMKVKISAQREETISATENKKYIQDIEVDLVKAGDTWLIDGAFWKAKR